jgi:hypothetical protein
MTSPRRAREHRVSLLTLLCSSVVGLALAFAAALLSRLEL